MKKKWVLLSSAGCLVCIVLLVVLAIAAIMLFGPHRVPFDSQAWKLGHTVIGISDIERFGMAEDLIDSEVLLGKPRAVVLDLLGPPPETPYFREYDLVYYLGAERSYMSIDSEWLLIKFNEDDQAIEVVIRSD
jgi:hypothetical protein